MWIPDPRWESPDLMLGRKPTDEVVIDSNANNAAGISLFFLGINQLDLATNQVMEVSGSSSSLSNQVINGEMATVADGTAFAGYTIPTPLVADENTPWEITFKVRRRGINNHGMLLGDTVLQCYLWVNNSQIEFASKSQNYYSFSTGYVASSLALYTITSDGGGASGSTLNFYIDGIKKQTITSATSDFDIRNLMDGYGDSHAFEGDLFYAKITTGVIYSDQKVKDQSKSLYTLLIPA